MLFAPLADVAVTSVDPGDDRSCIGIRGTTYGAACPGYGSRPPRLHGTYLRFPGDPPFSGRPVVLSSRVRRFACGASGCPRRTFVEQIPGLTRRLGRWTERLRSELASLGLALAGRAGERLAGLIGVPVSRSTVLRILHVSRAEPDAADSGRRRRVRDAQRSRLRHGPSRCGDAPTVGTSAGPGTRDAGNLASPASADQGHLPGPRPVLLRRHHARRPAGPPGGRPPAPVAQPRTGHRAVRVTAPMLPARSPAASEAELEATPRSCHPREVERVLFRPSASGLRACACRHGRSRMLP